MKTNKITKLDLYELIDHKLNTQSPNVANNSEYRMMATIKEILNFLRAFELKFLPFSFEVGSVKQETLVDRVLSPLHGYNFEKVIPFFIKAGDCYQVLSFGLLEKLRLIFLSLPLSSTPLTDILAGEADSAEPCDHQKYPTHVSKQPDFYKTCNSSIQKNLEAFKYIEIDQYEESACQAFDKLLNENKKIQVICVDIEFLNDLNMPYSEFIYSILARIPDLTVNLYTKYDQLAELLTNVVPNDSFSLILQCVFMLKVGKVKIKESSFISDIHSHIKHIGVFGLNYKFKLHNWNDVIRTKYDPNAVDIITSQNATAIAACKYWIISPLYSVNQIFEFKFPNSPEFFFELKMAKSIKICELREQAKQRQALNKVVERALKSMPMKTKSVSKNLKHLKLSSQSIDYLRSAKLIYESYSSDPLDLLNDKLYSIEVFIETLRTCQLKLVNLPTRSAPESITGKALQQHLTVLGHLWYEIFSFLKFLSSVSMHVKSINLRIFQDFLEEQGSEESSLLNFSNINLKIHSLSGFSGDTIIQFEILLNNLKNDIHRHNLYESSYVSIMNRMKKHKEYFRTLLNGEIKIYRVHFQGALDNIGISQKDLSTSFTKFMRYGKQAKPLSYLKGHLIRWDQRPSIENTILNYGDAILVFESNEKNYGLDIMVELQTYFSNFAAKDKHVQFKNLEIKLQPLWSSIPSLDFMELEVRKKDEAKKKILIEQFLPAFEYLDFFISLDMAVVKRVTHGSQHKPKAIISLDTSMEPINSVQNSC